MDKNEFNAIMEMAIAAEMEAHEFYKNVAATVSDASLKMIFKEFAEEEQGHRNILEGIKENEKQNFSFSIGPDYKVSEVVQLPQLTMTMKPSDAIALAMKKEEEAMKIYKSFAAASNDPEKQQIFTSLAVMEEGHKTKMEALYTQTAFPEVW